ncbi:hypothetical protein D3C86_2116210 [compost metagenome]
MLGSSGVTVEGLGVLDISAVEVILGLAKLDVPAERLIPLAATIALFKAVSGSKKPIIRGKTRSP